MGTQLCLSLYHIKKIAFHTLHFNRSNTILESKSPLEQSCQVPSSKTPYERGLEAVSPKDSLLSDPLMQGVIPEKRGF